MIDQNLLYSECPCGSGRKFKFCCYPAVRDDLPRDPSRADVTEAVRRRSHAARLVETLKEGTPLDLDRFHELIGHGLNDLTCGRYEQARCSFLKAKEEFGMLPTAYNNLMLCALVQGKLEETEEWAQEALRRFPAENPFGMAMAADIRYVKGDVSGALDIITQAEQIEPPSADQAARLCESMAHFKDHERILRYTEKSGYADDPEIALYRGIAYANLGRTAEAERCLHVALQGRQEDYARRILEDLSMRRRPSTICGDWMYFRPESFTLFAVLQKNIQKGGEQQLRLAAEAMAEFVEINANAGSVDLSSSIEALSALVCKRTERMLGALRSDASRPAEIRRQAKRAYDRLFAKNKLGKQLREVKDEFLQQMIITEEAATHNDLEPAYEESYFKAVRICLDPASPKKDLREALRLLEDLHAKVPDNPAVSNNYASALSRLGRTDEAVDMIRECFARFPEYVFGAANYLGLLMLMNRLEEAGAMVDNYRLPQRIHPDAYLAWSRKLMLYYERVGDTKRLRNVRRGVELVLEQFHSKS